MSCNLYELLVQVATCTGFLYNLQLVRNLSLYVTYIRVSEPVFGKPRFFYAMTSLSMTLTICFVKWSRFTCRNIVVDQMLNDCYHSSSNHSI